MNNTFVDKPYDTFVKKSLFNLDMAKEFLQNHLPIKTKNYINFNKGLELVNTEFIKKNFKNLAHSRPNPTPLLSFT